MIDNLNKIKELLVIQGSDGNWNYDPYNHGMYNGMELILSLIEKRETIYKEAPYKWLSEKENETKL